MDRDASPQAIRASYRARARVHHPDRAAVNGRSAVSMADINEAYRVLGDPDLRARYDRTLIGDPVGGGEADAAGADRDEDVTVVRRPARTARIVSPDGPARFPWRPMLVVALVGSVLVLVSAALADPPDQEVPDGILRTDSCVALEPNGDAREVACTGEDDLVVELLLPTGAQCPVGMAPHRDRLGLGVACIRP